MKNKTLVSNIINGVNAVSADIYVTKRLAYNMALAVGASLIYKYKDFKFDYMIKDLECFEMESVDARSCGIVHFETCGTLMVSKLELPVPFGTYIESIISVEGIDKDNYVKYYPSTLRKLASKKNRRFQNPIDTQYYYIRNKKLYIPDSHVRLVDVRMIPKDTSEINKCSSCTDTDCFLGDLDFNIPAEYEYELVQTTIQTVLQRFKVPADNQPDLIISKQSEKKK